MVGILLQHQTTISNFLPELSNQKYQLHCQYNEFRLQLVFELLILLFLEFVPEDENFNQLFKVVYLDAEGNEVLPENFIPGVKYTAKLMVIDFVTIFGF